MNEVVVYLKNGKIIVDFSAGALKVASINLAARLKRLPDVASASVQRDGNIVVSVSSVRDVPALQRKVYALANERIPESPIAHSDLQLSMF